MKEYNYKKGILLMLLCYLMWGLQPLYWNLCKDMDAFFLLAMRIIFASLFCLTLCLLQGKKNEFIKILKNKNYFLREMAASFLLLLDWAIYLWAIKDGRVMECSLGYYIQPIVVFAFGATVFHEKISATNMAALAVVVIGVAFSAKGFGRLPWVTVSLALFFAIYVAIKKSIPVDSTVTTSTEIILMIPFSIAILIISKLNYSNTSVILFKDVLLIIGSGIVTAAPMLVYSAGIKYLPLTAIGICQYLSPTISIFCGMILGEQMTKEKMISFIFVWLGIVIYVISGIYDRKKSRSD